MEHLARALLTTLSYLYLTLSAVLGFILYPLFKLFLLGSAAFRYSFMSAIWIPTLAIIITINVSSALNIDVLSSIALGILTTTALAGLFVGVLPVLVLFKAFYLLIRAPYEGAKIGWNEGLYALFSICFHALDEPSLVEEEQNADPIGDGLLDFLGINTNDLLEQLGLLTVDAARPALSEDEFNACELSAEEFGAMQANQLPPLTVDEIAKLEADGSPAVLDVLKKYKDIERYKTDTCPILAFRPEREETILLVKQYQHNGQWHPIPGSAHIFDKASLKIALVGTLTDEGTTISGHGDHPVTRDKILRPSNYQVDENTSYETRFVFHRYYANDVGEGLCQEANLLTRILRDRLQELDPSNDSEFNVEGTSPKLA